MKVTNEEWNEKAKNLIDRRKNSFKNKLASKSVLSDYGAHIRNCYIGKEVLDVGCGDQYIRKCLPQGVKYTGIDPFPSVPEAIEMDAEEMSLFSNQQFDTVYAFAMLDNVRDLPKALEEIKRVCAVNVLILTGISIEPDKYHTMKIEEQELIHMMQPFKVVHKEYLQPKVLLIEFLRP